MVVTNVVRLGAVLEEMEEIASCGVMTGGSTCNRPGKVFKVLEGECELNEVCLCSVCAFSALGPAEGFRGN